MALGGPARRYAEALLEIATGESAVPAYRSSLDSLRGAFGPEIVRALRDRRVPVDRRRAAVEAATAREPRAIRAVAVLLLERDRLALLPGIAQAYADLVDRREGIVKAKVTTAVELDEERRSEVVARLERTTGKGVRATFAVDPALLGGATVQLGDHLIDTSVRAQLEAMRAQLAS
jgi:F-type H+-transporting ATPase subunit delta